MRTYDPASLDPIDPTSFTWALAWARRLAGDVPTDGGAWPLHSMHDEEWAAWLRATAMDVDGTLYYRPHAAAAAVIRSHPAWATRLSIAGVFQEGRTPDEIAAAILAAGAWIDDTIQRLTGRNPTTGRTLWPAF
jgi:hypothetical protein